MDSDVKCRFCGGALAEVVGLGMSSLRESYVAKNELNSTGLFYPLVVNVCRDRLLVQIQEYVAPGEIFPEYAYFSTYSEKGAPTCCQSRFLRINGNR